MRWLLVLGLAGLTACSSGADAPRAERALPEPITVSSPAFTEGAAIPQQFTCDGENRSPPLAWAGVPAGTVEAALVVDDPDAPRGTYVHWVVVGLDPSSTELAEGAVPPDARQLPNSADRKSTRLNSSHQIISYAVFCLKKKSAGGLMSLGLGDILLLVILPRA